MKIVILDGYTVNPGDLSWDKLKKLGDLTVYDRIEEQTVVEKIGDAEIIYTNKTRITRETIEACPNLKYIGVLATGYNTVDVDAAKEKGVLVSNIPAYSTDAVAQSTFALLLEICHHVGEHSEMVRNGAWTNHIDFSFWMYPVIELAGKTMGIIGFGKIGQAVAKIAQALGMKVLVHSRSYRPELYNNDSCRYVTFDELLSNSDVISLHCPLFPETRGIINKNSIDKMKDGVIIINTSRGPLIVEEDLKAALDSEKVYGAAVDVVSKEPIEENNPLLKAKNIFITPHIAWTAKDARIRLINIAVKNLESYLAGSPTNIVNM